MENKLYKCNYYQCYLKEKGYDDVLKPSIMGKEMSEQEIVEHWGLDKNDIDWAIVFGIDNDNKSFEIVRFGDVPEQYTAYGK